MASKWVLRKPQPASRARLFCFSNAGRGASAFRLWQADLPGIEVCAVELPGRESRYGEPLLESLGEVVTAAMCELEPLFVGRFAFFGHSLGALVAFELTRASRRAGRALPERIFLSGHPAPRSIRKRTPRLSSLPDNLFLDEIRSRYGGIPDALLAVPELLDIYIPIMRADFLVGESYAYASEPPLDVAVSVLGGSEDESTPREALDAWSDETSRPLDVHVFPGGHFFTDSAREDVLRLVRERLV